MYIRCSSDFSREDKITAIVIKPSQPIFFLAVFSDDVLKVIKTSIDATAEAQRHRIKYTTRIVQKIEEAHNLSRQPCFVPSLLRLSHVSAFI